jgi:hypothetical protein
MILTNLNRWAIVRYFRSWKEGKGVTHARRAVPCVTRTRHTYFHMKKSCDLSLATNSVCVEKLLHHSYCTELMFYHF